MLITLKPNHTERDRVSLLSYIESLGLKGHVIPGENLTAIGVTGNRSALNPETFQSQPGVKEAIPVTKPYKLASRDFKAGETQIQIGSVTIGRGHLVLIAGPCAVESEEQTLRIAFEVKKAGAELLRGGAFKPRTSPYSFQGLGIEGLKILKRAREATGLPVVTEAIDTHCLESVAEYCDVIQIGARNMQNFSLLQQAGRVKKPILLKRGISATLEEWLMAAEYILDQGNSQVILCERGIRSYDPSARNLLDLSAVASLERLSHLPVIVDPSHGTGRRPLVSPLAQAAIAVGAQGVMIDVHDRPEEALCDGAQAISPLEYAQLVERLRAIFDVIRAEAS